MSHRSRSASSIDREVTVVVGPLTGASSSTSSSSSVTAAATSAVASILPSIGGMRSEDHFFDTLQKTSYGRVASGARTTRDRHGDVDGVDNDDRDTTFGAGDDGNDDEDEGRNSTRNPLGEPSSPTAAVPLSLSVDEAIGTCELPWLDRASFRSSVSLTVKKRADRLGYGPFQRQILVAAGLCFAADSMEVLLLSFLSIVLLVEWDLSSAEAASLTTFVFLGALAGTMTLGPLGDRIGRKPVFTLTACIIAIFGFATSLANSYWTLVVLRFFVGFGVGGLTVPFDTLAELIPQSSRGANLLVVEYFWTMGTLLTPVAAYLTLGIMGDPSTSWRVFVVLCALPCVLSTVIGYRVVPESPRWLLVQGKHDTALDILRQAAGKNGLHPLHTFPPGTKLRPDDDAPRHRHLHHHYHGDRNDNESYDDEPRESVWDALQELFSTLWKRTTIFLWISWAGLAICYYGTVLVITAVFAQTSEQDGNGDNVETYSFDYGAVLASASAEIAGTTMVLLTIDRVGRVVSQSVAYAAGGVSVFMLCWLASLPSASRTSLVLAAFVARLFFMGATCTTWVSTAEIFPTHLRTTGHASCNAIARLGGAVSPLLLVGAVGSTRDATAFLSSGVVLLVVSLLTAWSTWNLPETAGRGMGRAVATAMRQSEEGVFRCGPGQELPPSRPRRAGEDESRGSLGTASMADVQSALS